jgi:hypothetical protein
MWSDFLRGIVVRWRDETLAKSTQKKPAALQPAFVASTVETVERC